MVMEKLSDLLNYAANFLKMLRSSDSTPGPMLCFAVSADCEPTANTPIILCLTSLI